MPESSLPPASTSARRPQRRRPRRLRAVIAAALVLVAGGCGGGHDEHGGAAEGMTAKAGAAQGFLQAMVPHHEAAVDMAQVALREAKHKEVKALARDIRSAQRREIEQMQAIHQRLFDAPLEPDEGGHAALGLSAEEAGMGHGEAAQELAGAEPFDRAFLDEMVPHHEGAIRMAEAVEAKSDDREILALADAIVAAQRREIAQMREWRSKWYGEDGPAGGDDGHGGHGD